MLVIPLGSHAGFMSHLYWGELFQTASQSEKSLGHFAQVMQLARASISLDYPVMGTLDLQGEWSDLSKRHPFEHEAARRAVKLFPSLLSLSLCARLSQEPIQAQCLSKARSVILNWSRTYRPTGNPISESQFIPLFQAVDVMAPQWSIDEQTQIFTWLRQFVIQGDQIFAKLGPRAKKSDNNWQSWRLAIRGMVATVIQDASLLASTRDLLKHQIQTNIDAEGRTLDFQKRDAIHYQVYDLQALIEIKAWVPSLLGAPEEQRILAGLQFLKPFYTGQVKHVEFVKSAVKEDLNRKRAGIEEYQNRPWQPQRARHLLFLARALFPEIQNWTANAVDEEDSPLLKFEVDLLSGMHRSR